MHVPRPRKNRMKNYLMHSFSLVYFNPQIGRQFFVSDEIKGNFAIFVIGVLIGLIFMMLLFFVAFYYFKTRYIRQRNILLKKLNKELSRDVAEKETSIHQLQNEFDMFRATMHSIGDGLISTDVNGLVNFMNNSAENITGWTEREAMGRPFYEIYVINNALSQFGFDDVRERAEKNGLFEKAILRTKDGKEKIIGEHRSPIKQGDGEIIGLVILFKEEAAGKTGKDPSKKDSRLQSLSNAIHRIAHSLNNIFIGILGNISYVRSKLDSDDELYTVVDQAEEAALKARELTSKLFSATEGIFPGEGQPPNFCEFLHTVVQSALHGSDIKIKFTCSDDLWDVEMNQNQLRHVFQTISMYSRDAMPENGIFHIRAKNVIVKNEENLPIRPGNYVKASIRNQPAGISQGQLVSPLESPLSQPSGEEIKGLAATYAIVANHSGYMYTETEKELGTNLIIYLPAKVPESDAPKLYTESSILSNTGRILVMDDDLMIRNIAGRLLRFIGYEVVTVTSGDETIREYKEAMQKNKKFDVVILDLTVAGGMGGRDTIRALKEIDPHVKAVVSSGYSDDPIMTDYQKYGFTDLIAKPYKIYELGEVVFRVMSNY